jgi:hypothetical protein
MRTHRPQRLREPQPGPDGAIDYVESFDDSWRWHASIDNVCSNDQESRWGASTWRAVLCIKSTGVL